MSCRHWSANELHPHYHIPHRGSTAVGSHDAPVAAELAARYWTGYLDALEEIQSSQSDEDVAAELERTAGAMPIALVRLHDPKYPGRGTVLAVSDTVGDLREYIMVDQDGCIDESFRFWRVPEGTQPGCEVSLGKSSDWQPGVFDE